MLAFEAGGSTKTILKSFNLRFQLKSSLRY
jgi:hypothetical protein